MLRSRIIPCLLLHQGGLVKTRQFKDPKYVGDPLNAVKIFNEKEVDELMFIDIDATAEGYEPRMPLLAQVPGLGVKLGMMVLAAIGDITRFPTHKHLVGYAGLGARSHDSGDVHRGGRITKQGRRDLRAAMVQAAHNAVEHP